MSPEQQVTLAEQAKTFMETPAFADAVAIVRADWRNQWENSKGWQEREELWHLDQALGKVLAQLKVAVERGLQAQREIARRDSRATPARG